MAQNRYCPSHPKSRLFERTVRRGPYAGLNYWGCPHFADDRAPEGRCLYTEELDSLPARVVRDQSADQLSFSEAFMLVQSEEKEAEDEAAYEASIARGEAELWEE